MPSILHDACILLIGAFDRVAFNTSIVLTNCKFLASCPLQRGRKISFAYTDKLLKGNGT